MPFSTRTGFCVDSEKPQDFNSESKQIEINLGRMCNNDCVFCANGVVPVPERSFIPKEQVLAEIDQAFADGYRSLGFLGGEATIYPDMVEVVRHAQKRGFVRISLCTNGRRLADRDLLIRLAEAGVTRITLSIHHHREEVEDAVCARKGAFRQKERAIRNIVEGMRQSAGFLPHGFALNTCIHGLNCQSLAALASSFKEMGVRDIRFNFVMPEHKAVDNKRLVPALSSLAPSLERLAFWNESQGKMRITISDVPPCVLPSSFLTNPYLFHTYLGDGWDLDTVVVVRGGPEYTKDRFTWKKRRQNRLKAKAASCSSCSFDPLCEGTWRRYIELYGDHELAPLSVPVPVPPNSIK